VGGAAASGAHDTRGKTKQHRGQVTRVLLPIRLHHAGGQLLLRASFQFASTGEYCALFLLFESMLEIHPILKE
jgi:hypothetical protein